MVDIETLRVSFEDFMSEEGRQVSDDRYFTVKVHVVPIPETDLIALVEHCPASIVGCGSDTPQLVIEHFNEERAQGYKLVLSSAAYGEGMKYEGVPDHPHFVMVYVVRIVAL